MTQATFWDHVDVLRWSFIRIVCVWIVLAIGFFLLMPYIFDSIIVAPCNGDFVLYDVMRTLAKHFGSQGDIISEDFRIQLININLAAPLFIHISTAFALSIVTAVPYMMYEVWVFVSPAIDEDKRRRIVSAFLFGGVMFYLGVALGYFLLFPLTLKFLTSYQLSSSVDNMLSLSSYIDNFTMMLISMGIAFELPVILWLLSLMGVITRSVLKTYRRHAVVVIIIAAAVITPTSDPFTLSLVAVPLYMLYELSLLVVKKD